LLFWLDDFFSSLGRVGKMWLQPPMTLKSSHHLKKIREDGQPPYPCAWYLRHSYCPNVGAESKTRIRNDQFIISGGRLTQKLGVLHYGSATHFEWHQNMSSNCEISWIWNYNVLEQVYDVTKFLEDHPGGDDVLLSATGMKTYTKQNCNDVFIYIH
jgi:hypothetical protein